MSQAPVVWINVVGILLLVFLGLMFVGTIVGTILFLSGRRGSGLRRVGGSIGLVSGSALAVIVLFGSILGIARVQHSREVILRDQEVQNLRNLGERLHHQDAQPASPRPQPENAAPAPVNGTASSPADASLVLTPHDDRSVSDAGEEKRPEWTTRPQDRQGDVTQLVLASQQFATVEEARSSVAKIAKERLADDFQNVFRVSSQEIRTLLDETVKQLAVRQEFVETVQRDFGSFFAPMHRVWWQVELSPAVRTGLHPFWKSRAQEIRTIIVGAAIFDATLLFAGLSWFYRRRQRALASSPSPAPTVKPSAAVLGVGAATLLAQRCQRWWRR
jgi:hypothetical protein